MLHYTPQHVSSSTLLIIRRTNCITTASGIVTLCKQPCSMRVESGLQSALYISLLRREYWVIIYYELGAAKLTCSCVYIVHTVQ